MKLIDVDALDDAFTALRWRGDELLHWGDRPNWCLIGEEVEKLIADAPTIDAIPVEWLRRWRDVTDIPLLAMNIDSILKVWEESNKYWGEANKEQEAQDDGN